MTELMHFQPGKALYDAYQQGRGNYLAGQAFNSQGDQRQSALGQLAGLNPDKAMALKADFDEQDKADFTEFSNVILNAPEELKPQIYAKGVQRFGYKIRALGVEPPTDYRQALPLFEQLSKAAGGKGKYTGAPIIVRGEDGKDYYARYSDNGIEQTNFRPSDSYTYDTDGAGNVWRGAKRSGEYGPAPLEVGKQPSASPESTTNTIATNLQQILRDAGFDEASARDVADAYHSRVGSKPKVQYTDGVVADMPSPAAGQAPAGGQARVSVKPKEEKIETWGAPTAVTKNGKPAMIQISNLGNERERPDLAPADSTKAPSVDASNAAGFYKRMAQSEQIISQLEQQGYSPASNKGDYFTAGGTMTNWATSPKGQQYYNAATNWIRANLRKESGAAIGVDEAKQEFSTYFPIPGDTKETIEQKRQLRQQTAESVKGAGLPAMKYQDQQTGGKSQANSFDPLGILK